MCAEGVRRRDIAAMANNAASSQQISQVLKVTQGPYQGHWQIPYLGLVRGFVFRSQINSGSLCLWHLRLSVSLRFLCFYDSVCVVLYAFIMLLSSFIHPNGLRDTHFGHTKFVFSETRRSWWLMNVYGYINIQTMKCLSETLHILTLLLLRLLIEGSGFCWPK